MQKYKIPENIDSLLKNARLTQPSDAFKADLVIWIVAHVVKKKPMTEDDRSEVMLRILERFDLFWAESLAFPEEGVLSFFLKKGFNIRRTVVRQDFIPATRDIWILQGMAESEKDREMPTQGIQPCSFALNFFCDLPLIQACIFGCMFDFPLSPKQSFYLQSNFAKRKKCYSSWENLAIEKREKRKRSLLKIEGMVLRYSRLLIESKVLEKRDKYKRKKSDWTKRLQRLQKKPLFSQREVARVSGWSRKVVSEAYKQGVSWFASQRMELLHPA